MDHACEIQELTAADIDEVSGGSYALVRMVLDGIQAVIDKLPKDGGGKSDVGQKLQFQLKEANSVY